MKLLPISYARRSFDTSLLAAGIAMLVLMFPAGKPVMVAFLAAGVYLAAIGHRVRRDVPVGFSLALIACCVWSVGLSLLRREPISDNRELSYSLIEVAFVFLPLGICLVRRPLDAIVIGARLAVLGATVLAAIEFLVLDERAGLGSNAAIFGFMVAMGGIISRLKTRSAPAFLPDTRMFFYISFLPVVLSQTRAAWFVYALAALFDVVTLLRGRQAVSGKPLWRRIAVGVVVVALAVPLAGVVAKRFENGADEISRYQDTGDATGSVDVRLAMWQGALHVIAAHPLIGVGGKGRVEAVANEPSLSPESAQAIRAYKHLHNLYVDQALANGLIGLALVFSVFGTYIFCVFRQSGNPRERETAVCAVFLVATFGSFHGVLLNEWMIILSFGFMSIHLTDLKRRLRLSPASLRGRSVTV